MFEVPTLLMIAVAVAMSVIIFMWSQGFLSQTSSATGGQQGAQNVAAQSSISIELATFVTGGSGSADQAKIIVRNVGAVAVTLGSVTITGASSNGGFKGTLVLSTLPITGTGAAGTVTSAAFTATGSDGTWNTGTLSTSSSCIGGTCSLSLAKGSAATLIVSGTAGTPTQIQSGEVLSIKVTTTVGTFGQSQFTVPQRNNSLWTFPFFVFR